MNAKHLTLALLCPLFVGCSDFNWEEAEAIARSNTKTTVSAYTSTYADWNTAADGGTDAALNWEEVDNGWSVNGELQSTGPVWTGVMGFDGQLVANLDSAGWDLSVYYDQVTQDTLVLNGDMSWRWDVQTNDNGFHMEYEVSGEITANGDVNGVGQIDYIAILDVTGNAVDMSATGSVGGTPIDFSLVINLPL